MPMECLWSNRWSFDLKICCCIGDCLLDINNITFLIFFVLILGQAITVFRGTTLQGRFHPYWPLSLGMFAAYYLYFGLEPLWPKFGYTIANFFLFSGSVAQALLCKEWSGTRSKNSNALLWGLPVAVCLIYEVLRQYGTYPQRVTWIMGMLAVISVWRLVELIRLYRLEPRFTVKLMLLFVVGYLLFCVLRLTAVVLDIGQTLYSESTWGFATRSLGSTLTVLTHIAIAGYYIEKFWDGERQVLQAQVESLQTIRQLRSEVEKRETENEEMTRLISERDHMLMINSRFSTVSSLAMFNSAIVHELSQPLAALTLTLQESQLRVKDTDAVLQASIDQSLGLVQKIGRMNQSLRNLLMAQKTDHEAVAIGTCIDDMLPILQNETRRRAVQFTAPSQVLELNVLAHKVLLERIIFNLVANAMDALTGSGVAAKNPSHKPHAKPHITLRLAQQIRHGRPHALLSVQDNGPGFEPHFLAQEWLHFQSTKDSGMGVGLILCHYVLSTWNGGMLLQNLPTGGASVELWIPLQPA